MAQSVLARRALPLLLLGPTLAAHLAPLHRCSPARLRSGRVADCVAVETMRDTRRASLLEPVNLSPFAAVRSAISSSSFGEFMAHMRSEQGDAIMLDLWPFAPKTYLLMGKEANRDVLEGLDPSLEQILQELINVLPVSAKVPSEVDVALQRKVASLFQSEKIVNARLPIFAASAQQMQQRWSGLPAGSELNIFCELSEYVLLADLEVIYGKTFREAHGDAIIAEFAQWVDNIAKGNSPIGFFKALGELLKETMADMQVRPELYVDERSVLGVYLESGALERHDEEALVGLLSMTLMAAVFNTQVRGQSPDPSPCTRHPSPFRHPHPTPSPSPDTLTLTLAAHDVFTTRERRPHPHPHPHPSSLTTSPPCR
jgi:hypothetical protein